MMQLQHHAFVIEAEAEEGIARALGEAERELGMETRAHPDIVILRFGFCSVADARSIGDIAVSAPVAGAHKVFIIAAGRISREAQNALLKLFEEPPPGVYLFLILPSLDGLLPTLRSRVQVLTHKARGTEQDTLPVQEFIAATREKRSAIIKKLTNGGDDEERQEFRRQAIALVNGIEAVAYAALAHAGAGSMKKQQLEMLLSDIATLRPYLYDQSAPVRLVLEHLSLVLPKDLV